MLGLRHTVLRPVFFMDNFLAPEMQQAILAGTLPFALPPDTKLQMIAVTDIGAFAALAFSHPEEFEGKALELAGDELTTPEAADRFRDVLGYPVPAPAPRPGGGAPHQPGLRGHAGVVHLRRLSGRPSGAAQAPSGANGFRGLGSRGGLGQPGHAAGRLKKRMGASCMSLATTLYCSVSNMQPSD